MISGHRPLPMRSSHSHDAKVLQGQVLQERGRSELLSARSPRASGRLSEQSKFAPLGHTVAGLRRPLALYCCGCAVAQ